MTGLYGTLRSMPSWMKAVMTFCLPVRLPWATIPNCSEGPWPPHITFYWDKHPDHPQPSHHRRPALQKNSHPQLLHWHQHPNNLPGQKGATLHQSQWGAHLWQEGLPTPRSKETPPWFQSLKPSQADAFLRDSDLVVEARLCFFSKHSYNFNQNGNCDLSEVFKKLTEKAGLLGTNIYEIEASCTGPEELKQANYTLQSLPKGLRFLSVVPTMESPKVMGLMGIHRCSPMFCQVYLLPVVWERRPKWRDSGQPPKNHALQARPSV